MIYKTTTSEDSKKKSSRSKADLFEVLVALLLSEAYHLQNNKFEILVKELKSTISKFPDGKIRVEEQYRRSEILLPALIKLLNLDIVPKHGILRRVDWVGRAWQQEPTLSDLNLTFDSSLVIGLSLKSTRQGLGTQKNLGYEKLRSLLGLDLTKEINNMWKNTRLALSGNGDELDRISLKSKSEIKKAKYRFPYIQDIGRRYGSSVQEIAVDQSVKLFNNLARKNKLEFLIEILGIDSTNPLLNALMVNNEPRLYWNETMRGLVEGELASERLTAKSYRILSDGKPIVRVQVSFTNGIGLSAFCERAFLL